jgi:hypothetical protein
MKAFPARGWLLLGTTHLLAIAAGVVLFRSIPALSPDGRTGSDIVSDAPNTLSSGPRKVYPPAASVHEAAWRALSLQGLTRAERRRAGDLILRDWIQADWHAALDAVMKENSSDSIYLGEFLNQFVRDPIPVWELIEKKAYGARTASLKTYWIEALTRVGRPNPARQKLFASLPQSAQAAIQASR